MRKSPFYEAWVRNKDHFNTITTTDKMAHARKRRILNSAFSDRSLRAAEPYVIKHVTRWVELLLDRAKGNDWTEPMNMSQVNGNLAFDLLGDLCFGIQFETKEPGENRLRAIPPATAQYMKFMYPLAQSPMLDLWIWLKPRGLDWMLQKISPPDIKYFFQFVEESVDTRIKLEEDREAKREAGESVRNDMFHFLFRAKDPETGERGYQRHELIAESTLLIVAGTDTTSVTLCGLLFYITRYPRVYAKLTDEIRSTFESLNGIRSGRKLQSLQYTKACLSETLRLCPGGLAELQRLVLPGGMMVDGDFIPAGTQIGCSPWVLNNHEEPFPDPSVFRPERWIVDERAGVSEEDVAKAESCFFPFSIGPNHCPGKNLAWLELLITTATLLYQMDVRAAPGETLGEGKKELGWGARNPKVFQLTDAFITLRDGPVVQFKKR
jgi:cytochrome P450